MIMYELSSSGFMYEGLLLVSMETPFKRNIIKNYPYLCAIIQNQYTLLE